MLAISSRRPWRHEPDHKLLRVAEPPLKADIARFDDQVRGRATGGAMPRPRGMSPCDLWNLRLWRRQRLTTTRQGAAGS